MSPYNETAYEVEYTWAPYEAAVKSPKKIRMTFRLAGEALTFRSKCCEAIVQQKRRHGCDDDVVGWLEDTLPAPGTMESVSPVLRVERTAMVREPVE